MFLNTIARNKFDVSTSKAYLSSIPYANMQVKAKTVTLWLHIGCCISFNNKLGDFKRYVTECAINIAYIVKLFEGNILNAQLVLTTLGTTFPFHSYLHLQSLQFSKRL